MKQTIAFLLRLLAVLAVLGAIAFVVVKYIDVIMSHFYKLKNKLCKCNNYDDDYDDVELEDVCLDHDCPCQEQE